MSDALTPITRKETFLAKAGGQNVVTPTPITREETFLQAIIDNGSGGGGGGGGGVLVCTMNLDTGALDKTWQEINDAGFAVLNIGGDIGILCSKGHSDAYYATFAMLLPAGTGFDDPIGFMANSANDYPVFNED